MALEKKKANGTSINSAETVKPKVEISPDTKNIGDQITFKRNPDANLLRADEIPVELKSGQQMYVPNNGTYVTFDRNGEHQLTEAGKAYLENLIKNPADSLSRYTDNPDEQGAPDNDNGKDSNNIVFNRAEPGTNQKGINADGKIAFKLGPQQDEELGTGVDYMSPREIALAQQNARNTNRPRKDLSA